MAALITTDVSSIGCFDCQNQTGIAARWKRWIRAFDLYAHGKGVVNAEQKRSLLLHTAGMDVQDIFYTLTLVEGEEGDDAFDIAKKTLENYFTPQSNVPFERHEFRAMAQEPTEMIEQFVTRLRLKAETCEFDNIDGTDS